MFPPAQPGAVPPAESAAFADHLPAEAGLFVQPRMTGEPIPDDWDLVGELSALSSSPAEASTPAPSPPPVVAAEPVPKPGPDQAAVAAFLAACGLEPGHAADPVALMAQAGRLLAGMVAELHALLAIRSLAKREFGLERTMIARSDNNPLKFSTAPQEALALLLAPEVPGLLAGEEAVREAFEGIRSHQLALLSATQSALASLCARLAPEAIVASPPFWARPLPFAWDAARWAAYQQAYPEVVASLDADMREVLSGDPAQARPDAREEHGHAG
ncbi:type VI secretion system-associated FHA domain protein TagH [Pseudoroseomonas wenyumeiae]